MCELLGLSANQPTDLRFSLAGLFERGGRTGHHSDGWGLGLYEGKSARTFHDHMPSTQSQLADYVVNSGYRSQILIGHVRKANRGRVCLENTHPFRRELWGRDWLFAHNGQLKGIKKQRLHHYQTIGTTDSEHAFCLLLDRLRQRYPRKPGSDRVLFQAIQQLCDELSQHGVFNILLSDSNRLYTYCSKRLFFLSRAHPFATVHFIDKQQHIDLDSLNDPDNRMIVIASRALTEGEPWQRMQTGEFRVFDQGRCLFHTAPQLTAAA